MLRPDNAQPYQTPNITHRQCSLPASLQLDELNKNSPMAPYKVTDAESGSTEQYSVYQHTNLFDPTIESSQLIHTASDFSTAYSALRNHAGLQIGERPEWGAISEVTQNNAFEILGHDQEVPMRYSIDTVCNDDDPPEHYGMFVDLDVHSAHNTKNFVIGGYKSLGEASNAMKTSAQASLAQHAGVRLMERSIELVDEKGEVRQRYMVVKGHWQNGEFIAEEEWPVGVKATNARNHRLPTPSSLPPDKHETPQPQNTPFQDKLDTPASLPIDPEIDLALPAPESWCTCHTPDDGTLMICCENDDCPIHWHHARCMGVEKEPVGDWWCPACAPTHAPAAKRKDRKSMSAKKRPGQNVKMEKGEDEASERKKRKKG
jgi:hypothetical protein